MIRFGEIFTKKGTLWARHDSEHVYKNTALVFQIIGVSNIIINTI